MKREFDYSSLIGRIRSHGTMELFASELHITPQTLYSKLNNRTEFKQSEILTAAKILGINSKDFNKYFFTTKVEKTQ